MEMSEKDIEPSNIKKEIGPSNIEEVIEPSNIEYKIVPYNIDKGIFANKDRNLHKNDFALASNFARKMFKYVLSKYSETHTIQLDDKERTYFCEHIGEAIIVLSFTNRLSFKCIFDGNQTLFLKSDFLLEKVVCAFVKNLYVEGYVEQFLIICGFFIDLAIYFHIKFHKGIADSLCEFFGDMFRYVMRDIFYTKGGGWTEVKRQAKPWWHTYRNYLHEREVQLKRRRSGVPYHCVIADLHKPIIVLENENFTNIMRGRGYTTKIKTSNEYRYVGLDSVVQKMNPGRDSPICDSDKSENTVGPSESERQPINEPKSDVNDGEKNKQKSKKKL